MVTKERAMESPTVGSVSPTMAPVVSTRGLPICPVYERATIFARPSHKN